MSYSLDVNGAAAVLAAPSALVKTLSPAFAIAGATPRRYMGRGMHP